MADIITASAGSDKATEYRPETATLADPAEIILSAMILSQECGLIQSLRQQIRANDEILRQFARADQLERYSALRERSIAAFEFEDSHGAGSLLNVDHPFTCKLIKFGIIEVDEGREVAPVA